MYCPQTSQQLQLHIQANAFPFLSERNENLTKVAYKGSTSPNNYTVTKAKHGKVSEYWLNQLAHSNRFAVL
jgi:hypothetical protein